MVSKLGLDENAVDKYFLRDDEAEVDRRLTAIEVARILKNVQIATPVLDLGIGHGVLVDALLKKFGECSVVEGSKRLAEDARSKHKSGLHIYQDDFETFEPPQKFSTIFATGILHHVKDPSAVLRRVAGWLADGGNVVISVPNGNSVHRAMGVALGIQENLMSNTLTGQRSGVQHVFSSAAIDQIIGASGLRVRKIISSYVKVVSNSQMSHLTDSQLEQLFEFATLIPLDFHATIVVDCVLQETASSNT